MKWILIVIVIVLVAYLIWNSSKTKTTNSIGVSTGLPYVPPFDPNDPNRGRG